MKQNEDKMFEEWWRGVRRTNIRFNIYRVVICAVAIFLIWWLPPYTYRKMVKEPIERRFEEIDGEWARKDSLYRIELEAIRSGDTITD